MHRPAYKLLLTSAAVVSLLTATGCGGSDFDATVQGTVTIDGELATNGAIAFNPVDGGPIAVGDIAKDGSFALRVGRGNPGNPNNSGIPSGKYIATVSIFGPSADQAQIAAGGPSPAGPRLIADKYSDKDTSGLEYTVNEGRNVFVVELQGPWANPEPVEKDSDGAADAKKSKEEPKAEESPQSGAATAAAAAPASVSPDASSEQGRPDESAQESSDKAPEAASEPPSNGGQQAPEGEQQQ